MFCWSKQRWILDTGCLFKWINLVSSLCIIWCRDSKACSPKKPTEWNFLTNLTVWTRMSCIFKVMFIFGNLNLRMIDKFNILVSKSLLSLELRNLETLVFLKIRFSVENSRLWSSLWANESGIISITFSCLSKNLATSLPRNEINNIIKGA